MPYSTTDFKTFITDATGYEFDVIVEMSYWMARRPFSEDDGDELDIVSVKAAHQVEDGDTLKVIHCKGDEVECDEIMKDSIRERFVQHLLDCRADYADR